ncbi:MAG: RNA polymerase sigma factor, partial [Phycisphaerae bacterium]|nr:RNA polymerase sigma factor [Phycisphaerae bacterium]
AVRLVVCNGLSYQEAAESLGVPVSTVNNWKYRGLQRLKDMREDNTGSENAA